MSANSPILTAHLFPVLERKLVELLRSLGPADWSRPTLARQWTVKDVAAHLLDGSIKRLAMQRDGYFGLSAPGSGSYASFIAFINRNNAEWVQAAKRISPTLLVEMIENTSKQMCQLFAELDPNAPAIWAVTWAGENDSANWFDIAREYTERWHHQQQIRVATGRDAISSRELFYPVLDTFLRGLPHAFREVVANRGTLIQIDIQGEAGGTWFLEQSGSKWQLRDDGESPAAKLTLDQELAWRVFTKAVDPETAAAQAGLEGDQVLARQVLSLVAVLA